MSSVSLGSWLPPVAECESGIEEIPTASLTLAWVSCSAPTDTRLILSRTEGKVVEALVWWGSGLRHGSVWQEEGGQKGTGSVRCLWCSMHQDILTASKKSPDFSLG